jgi:hypothetical protein
MDQMDNVIRFPMDHKPTPEAVPVTPPPAVRYDKSLTRVIAEGTWAVIWMGSSEKSVGYLGHG